MSIEKMSPTLRKALEEEVDAVLDDRELTNRRMITKELTNLIEKKEKEAYDKGAGVIAHPKPTYLKKDDELDTVPKTYEQIRKEAVEGYRDSLVSNFTGLMVKLKGNEEKEKVGFIITMIKNLAQQYLSEEQG